MKFIDKHTSLLFFIQLLVGGFCSFVTVYYIFEKDVSFIRAIVFSLLFASTIVLIKQKKQKQKVVR